MGSCPTLAFRLSRDQGRGHQVEERWQLRGRRPDWSGGFPICTLSLRFLDGAQHCGRMSGSGLDEQGLTD